MKLQSVRRWELVLDAMVTGGFIVDVIDHWREFGAWTWIWHVGVIGLGLWVAFFRPVEL
jgi:hypothetical protein